MDKRKFIKLANAGRIRRIIFHGIVFYVSDEADIWSETNYTVNQKYTAIIERKHAARENLYEKVLCRCRDRTPKTVLVHRLVWLAFRGEVPPGLEIDHIDQNKHNNRLDNLQLVTHNENVRKSRYQGTFSRFLRPVRLSVPGTEFYQDFASISEAARYLGSGSNAVSKAVLKGHLHKGVKIEFIKPTKPCDTEAKNVRHAALKQQGQSNNFSYDTSL